MKKCVCIVGPTGSGKSTLGLWLASQCKGAIINADSLQIYKDLPHLTARPSEAEFQEIPHYLYGFLDPQKPFSVSQWLTHVEALLPDVRKNDTLPFFVGGTGLYIKALLEGLHVTPSIPVTLRHQLRERLQAEGVEALYQELQALAPDSAQLLSAHDQNRILRALEVVLATGMSLTQWRGQMLPTPLFSYQETLIFVLAPPRALLYQKAESRLDKVMTRETMGFIETLLDMTSDLEKMPLAKALGVKECIAYVKGQQSFDEALRDAKTRTRNYIKRQETWFRHQIPQAYILDEIDNEARRKRALKILCENIKN